MSREKRRDAAWLSAGAVLALALCIGRPVAAAEDAAKAEPARQAMAAEKGRATGGETVAKAAAEGERGVVPPPLPPGSAFGRVMRQVHFAYRPDGGDFSGGHSTYSVHVDGTGAWSFQPLHRPEGLASRSRASLKSDGATGRSRPTLTGKLVRGTPVRIATVSISAGETSAVDALPRLSVAADGSLRIAHALAVESLRNTDEGLEQSWTFERRPARSEDLVVRLAVSGQRYGGETKSGLHFVDPDAALGVRYGVATWVDATGRRTEVPPRYEGGEIVLRVPAAVVASSGFPAVLDPLLSPEQGTDDPVISPVVGGTESPTITWDGTNYLIVWSDCRDPFDGNTCGIWAARVNPTDGALVDPTGVPIAFNDGYTNFFNFAGPQGVACEATQCLITWWASASVLPSPLLKGRFFIKATPNTPSAEFTITSLPPDNWEGGAIAYNGSVYLVGYSLLAPSFNPVVGNIVHSDRTVDAQFTIEQSCASGIIAPRTVACASQHRNPVVASDGTSFYVAWDEQDLNAGANRYFTFIFGRGVSGVGTPQGAGAVAVTPTTENWNHQGLFTQPGLAWDGSGNYVVAWDDTRACPGVAPLSSCSDTRIYARQVSAAFVPAAAELELTTDAAAQQQFLPTLSRSSASSLLVTWDDGRGGIWGELIRSGPLALNGGNFSLAGGRSSSVASDGTNYAVAYSNNSQAYVAGVTSSGGSQFAAERVSNSANTQVTPALAFDGTNFLAVWSDSRNSPRQKNIYAARISPTGTVLDLNGIAISTTTDEAAPAVAFASASSSYLVVWTTPSGVRARRVNLDGTTPSAEQPISVSGSSPSVASDGTNFLIVDSVPQSDFPGSISAVLVGPDATASTVVTISNTIAPDAQTAVGYSPTTNTYLVVWGEGGDIRGQRVTTAGNPLGGATGFVIANATGHLGEPSVAFDGTNFVVVWSDAGGVKRDIYGARVSDAGTLLDPSGVLLSPAGGHDKRAPRVTSDGVQTTVVWLEPETGDLMASLVTPDLGSILDTLVVATDGTMDPPALARDGLGHTLIGDTHFDTANGIQSFRVRLRFLANAGDAIPPTTVASASPPPNAAGWNNSSPVIVTLTATDDAGGSGVQSITVSVNGGSPMTTVGAVAHVSISIEGQTVLTFLARDQAGNVETPQSLTVRVDLTPPVLSLPGPLSAAATGPTGTAVGYVASATDLNGATVSCAPPSGAVFPIEMTTVGCTATDTAGNTSGGSFVVTVRGGPAQLRTLIQVVGGFGLPLVLRLRLEAELTGALILLDAGARGQPAACSLLNVFLQDVRAQSGRQLTAAQASRLVAAATQIRAAIGCH